MENSHKYFENRDCKYYPCHKGIDEINCMFCYCPFYTKNNCPGNPMYKDKNGMMIKVCTDCTFPHQADNYDALVNRLKKG